VRVHAQAREHRRRHADTVASVQRDFTREDLADAPFVRSALAGLRHDLLKEKARILMNAYQSAGAEAGDVFSSAGTP